MPHREFIPNASRIRVACAAMFSRSWVLGLLVMLMGDAPLTAQQAALTERPRMPSSRVAEAFSRLEWHALENGYESAR